MVVLGRVGGGYKPFGIKQIYIWKLTDVTKGESTELRIKTNWFQSQLYQWPCGLGRVTSWSKFHFPIIKWRNYATWLPRDPPGLMCFDFFFFLLQVCLSEIPFSHLESSNNMCSSNFLPRLLWVSNKKIYKSSWHAVNFCKGIGRWEANSQPKVQ